MNIYVGNLSYETTEDDLRQAFKEYGEVSSVNIIKDKYSGKSRGFAFVEMASNEEALEAVTNLNGKELNGRTLNINQARSKDDKGSRPFKKRSRGGYRENW